MTSEIPRATPAPPGLAGPTSGHHLKLGGALLSAGNKYLNFCFDFHQFILFFIDILDFRVSNDVYRAISKQAHKTEIHFLEFSVTPPNITEILSCPRSLFRN